MLPIPSPTETGLLRLTMANQYAALPGGELGPEPFILFAQHVDEQKATVVGLPTLLEALRKPNTCKSPCLHTYIGGLKLADEKDDSRFPFADIALGRFSSAELIHNSDGTLWKGGAPEGYHADISQPAVRNKLSKLIVAEAIQRRDEWGFTGLYVDNIGHPSMGMPLKWADTLAYLGLLRDGLHDASMTLLVNVSFAPGHKKLPPEDVQAFVDLVDGCALEMAASQSYIDDMNLYVEHWQALSAKPCVICDVPAVPPEQWPQESLFLAYVALIVDNSYVYYPQDQPRQGWFAFPAEFKDPAGPVEVDGRTISRKFVSACPTCGQKVLKTMWADLEKRIAGVK